MNMSKILMTVLWIVCQKDSPPQFSMLKNRMVAVLSMHGLEEEKTQKSCAEIDIF